MKFEALNDENKIGVITIPDGYNGHMATVSVHYVDGDFWYKTKFGCFRPASMPDVLEVLGVTKKNEVARETVEMPYGIQTYTYYKIENPEKAEKILLNFFKQSYYCYRAFRRDGEVLLRHEFYFSIGD